MSEFIILKKRRVKTDRGAYLDYNKIAFKVASSIVHNKEDAEDIAQVTTMRYLLNESKIGSDSARSWIIQTARNESYHVLGMANLENEIHTTYFEEIEREITRFLIGNADSVIEKERYAELLNIIQSKFTSQERSILKLYLNEGRKIKEYFPTKGLKFKEKSLTQKMYRLRKTVRAEYLKSLGLKTPKNPMRYRLNENLNCFIRVYLECLEKRSFKSISRYFKEIGVTSKVPSINIKKILDQDVELIGPRLYKIYVNYIDNRETISNFTVIFEVSDVGSLIVKKMPNTNFLTVNHLFDECNIPPELLDKIEMFNKEVCNKLNGHEYLIKLKNLSSGSI